MKTDRFAVRFFVCRTGAIRAHGRARLYAHLWTAKTHIILAVLSSFLLFTFRSHLCRTGVYKSAGESDGFACDFGQRCVCLTSSEHF